MASDIKREVITDQFIDSLCTRLSENKRVRRKLPIWGRVHIDRQLPFLCVYRKPVERKDTGTEKLIFGEAAYLTASGEEYLQKNLYSLIRNIAKTQARTFDRFLIIEVWSSSNNINSKSTGFNKPEFIIHAPSGVKFRNVISVLENSLKSIKIQKQRAEVRVESTKSVSPNGYKPLIRQKDIKDIGVALIGMEVRTIYRNPKTNEVYPLVFRSMRRTLSRSLKKAFFEFTRVHTKYKVPHFLSLGRRSVVKAVWDIDNKLADISNSFSLLLTVTPTNPDAAFSAFKRSRYEKVPKFIYHPIPVDTSFLKRTLHNIQIERVEDPVLAHIFRQQQDDIDRRLTLLFDRNTRRFLYGSMQIYGGVQNWIFDIAIELLNNFNLRSSNEIKGGYITAEEFELYAKKEIEYHSSIYNEFKASCHIRDDISGLMVSKGKLFIGKHSKIPKSRIEALIQHEIGTHLLTYFNGKAQPFKQLYVGLAGYDELQEGIAVLSEYLVGGLSKARMRLLAGRVIAVRRLVEGATFIETFRELNSVFGFEKQSAFSITMRVYRGGGLTKDATYLKGLLRVLKFIANGGDIETLFLGKFNIDHIPLIRELMYRNILLPAPLVPRYLEDTKTKERLAILKNNIKLSDLVSSDKTRRIKR